MAAAPSTMLMSRSSCPWSWRPPGDSLSTRLDVVDGVLRELVLAVEHVRHRLLHLAELLHVELDLLELDVAALGAGVLPPAAAVACARLGLRLQAVEALLDLLLVVLDDLDMIAKTRSSKTAAAAAEPGEIRSRCRCRSRWGCASAARRRARCRLNGMNDCDGSRSASPCTLPPWRRPGRFCAARLGSRTVPGLPLPPCRSACDRPLFAKP